MVKKYKVTAVNFSDFFVFHKNEYGQYHVADGIDSTLLNVLAQKLHFRYEIVVPEDNLWGTIAEDGNWTGMVGMISRKEADLAVDSIAVSYERSKAVRFSYPYIVDRTTFVTRAPELLPKDFVFIHPFHFLVWLFIALSLFFSSWLISFLYNDDRSRMKNISYRLTHWGEKLELLYSLFLGQGNYNSFQQGAEKVFIVFWIMSRSVIVFSYVGVLLSILMVPLREPSINTVLELKDAIEKGKVQVLGMKGTMQISLILGAEEGVVKVFGDNLRQHPENIFSVEESIKRVLEGRYALFMLQIFADISFNKRGPEKYFVSNDSVGHTPLAIAFNKDFCCIRRFNSMILRIQAAGLYQKWYRDTLFRLQLNAPRKMESDHVRPLVLSDFVGAFWVLVSGYVWSFMILSVETIVHRCKSPKQWKL